MSTSLEHTRLDLHVHTHHSLDSRAVPLNILSQAHKKQLGGIAITDHDRWAAVPEILQLQQQYPEFESLLIVPAIEVTTVLFTSWGVRFPHVILLNATPELLKQFLWWVPFPWFPGTERLLRWASEQPDVVTVIPHARPAGDLTSLSFSQVIRWSHYIDALEVINERPEPHLDRARIKLAQELNLGMTGSSDAHASEDVGNVVTLVPGKVQSVPQLLEAIRQKKTSACVPR